MVRRKQENGRVKSVPLANFHARIVRDLVFEDGEHQSRAFTLEAELEGRRVVFTIPAAEFGRISWVLNQLGPQAIVYPGQQQHARAAIQYLSGTVRQERIFAHLGWIKHGPEWLYLDATGALGATGAVSGFELQLPSALQKYQFGWAENRAALIEAVRASLRCLSVAPDRITFPLLGVVYRAALGKVDFSMFLAGQTGVFKTALAALCQQHFGAELDASHLPMSFASTAQAIQSLAFHAKDTLLVVDDFVPTGRYSDSALESAAEQLFRSAGNHQGRSRMSGNGRPSAAHPPRALLLATGEKVPRGQSIRARLLIVEVAAGDVNRTVLSDCQSVAERGLLATSMGGFLSWVAARYDELQRRLQTRVREIRSQNHKHVVHARLPGALAELQSAWEIFLDFAIETGAMSNSEQHSLVKRNREALDQLAAAQATYQAADPALRFVTLLQAALASGRAHVVDRCGKAPEHPATWGWRRQVRGRWMPSGVRIGWLVGSDLFLDSAASYDVAQQMAAADPIQASEQTLRHRLRERGYLASVDSGRQMVQVRRTLEGTSRQVLHLKAAVLSSLSRDHRIAII